MARLDECGCVYMQWWQCCEWGDMLVTTSTHAHFDHNTGSSQFMIAALNLFPSRDKNPCRRPVASGLLSLGPSITSCTYPTITDLDARVSLLMI
jgi:hypothetical protein